MAATTAATRGAEYVVDRVAIQRLMDEEKNEFERKHQRSKALFEEAKSCLLGGVPMSWMVKWAGGFPIFVKGGKGATFTDVDGNNYLDLCLGDTGSMTGHAPEITVAAIKTQVEKGLTFMLPTEDAVWVGKELQRRFGLPFWQMAMTATDANRFALRLCRYLTKRPYVLVFNWCYHGTVDETFATINDATGRVNARPGNVGPQVDPANTTKVIEFNDIPALEAALSTLDVACVLAEPAMTNIGIIHPDPGYHEALRRLTRKYGTLLIIDETHTICAGPGGFTKAFQLEPDLLTIGKPIAGGIPAAVYGLSQEVATRLQSLITSDSIDTSGIGGTLTANALTLASMRATLENVLVDSFYDKTIPLATRWTQGVQSVIDEFNLPWNVTQLGNRGEYWFRREPARNGLQAVTAYDSDLDRYMHLFALNRGILLTPFHLMALVAPDTTLDQIDYHTQVFRDAVLKLLSSKALRPSSPSSSSSRL